MEDIVLFGKTYKWNKGECGSGQFLDLRLMEENEMEELKKIIVLNDKGVTCFEHKEHGCIPLEPHCIECGRRLINDNVLFAFGYVTEFVEHCKSDGLKVVSACEECGVCDSGFPKAVFSVDSEIDLSALVISGSTILFGLTRPCTYMKTFGSGCWPLTEEHYGSPFHISCVEVPNTITNDYDGMDSVLVLRVTNTKLTQITVGDALQMLVDIKWNPHRDTASFCDFELKEDKEVGTYFEIAFDT